MHLQRRDLLVQDWPGRAVVTLTPGGGTAPLSCRTLVLRPEGDGFVTVPLHGPTLPAVEACCAGKPAATPAQ